MSDEDQKLVTIKTFPERTQAELARAALEARGIQAMIQADDCGNMLSALTFTMGAARLMVFEKDTETALQLLEERVNSEESAEIESESEAEDREPPTT